MKKTYLIIALGFLSIVGCQKKENDADNTSMDSIQQADTTAVSDMKNDTTSTSNEEVTDSSDVELLNKMKTSSKTIEVDPSKGKYALAETKWKLIELNGKAVKSNSTKDYFINLDSKSGKFAAFAGCNSIMGAFVMKATTKLAFSKIVSTKMACQDSKTESDFIKALGKVDNYMIEGTTLHFHKGKLAAVAKFEAIK